MIEGNMYQKYFTNGGQYFCIEKKNTFLLLQVEIFLLGKGGQYFCIGKKYVPPFASKTIFACKRRNYFLFVYKHNNFIWDNEGKRNFILVLLHANFTYLDVLTSVLSENSMKEFLLLFSELLAQPGRACLLCFTPEFDKVLVSLAHRCLGASLCQIRGLSAIG